MLHRMRFVHGAAKLQLTIAGSMSRSCERHASSSSLMLYVALLILLNLCIIDTTYGGVVLPGATVPSPFEPALLVCELSCTVRDHCWFDSLPRVLGRDAFSRRVCCCILLGRAAFSWWRCCYIHILTGRIHSRYTMTLLLRLLGRAAFLLGCCCVILVRTARFSARRHAAALFSATIPRHDTHDPQHPRAPSSRPFVTSLAHAPSFSRSFSCFLMRLPHGLISWPFLTLIAHASSSSRSFLPLPHTPSSCPFLTPFPHAPSPPHPLRWTPHQGDPPPHAPWTPHPGDPPSPR